MVKLEITWCKETCYWSRTVPRSLIVQKISTQEPCIPVSQLDQGSYLKIANLTIGIHCALTIKVQKVLNYLKAKLQNSKFWTNQILKDVKICNCFKLSVLYFGLIKKLRFTHLFWIRIRILNVYFGSGSGFGSDQKFRILTDPDPVPDRQHC